MRILLVEDDALLGEGIQTGLAQDGYTVDWLKDGRVADKALQHEEFDLLVLDLNLPGLSGLDLLKALRSRESDIPVLILTARDTVSDRIAGLDCGADDYMVKPFDIDELSARMRALLRRSSGRASPYIVNGELCIDPSSHRVTMNGREVALSQREFAILELLAANAGRALPRSRIEESLYGWESDVGSNALEVHIHHLRKKLDNNWIRTIRGVGYMMEKQ
ncbi:MAG: response regulator transcription factor [Gammaproteobacteria bacterium]|nr:response regulator transcription factor [Gammaproteobacteria bacterium]